MARTSCVTIIEHGFAVQTASVVQTAMAKLARYGKGKKWCFLKLNCRYLPVANFALSSMHTGLLAVLNVKTEFGTVYYHNYPYIFFSFLLYVVPLVRWMDDSSFPKSECWSSQSLNDHTVILIIFFVLTVHVFLHWYNTLLPPSSAKHRKS